MSVKFKQGAILALVVAMTVLSGCAASGYGANSGSDTALIGDLLTERNILRALYDEPGLTGAPISVGCVDGIVTLSGKVNTEIERSLAEQVARSIDGVTKVNNNLSTRG